MFVILKTEYHEKSVLHKMKDLDNCSQIFCFWFMQKTFKELTAYIFYSDTLH